MLGPVRYPKRFLRGHALAALVCAHGRVHVQGMSIQVLIARSA